MRLAGQIKGGFYAAPEEAVALAASHLRAPAEPFAMLDPCAGQGAAVAQLAGLLGCRPDLVHAIELDEGRAKDLHAALPDGKVLAPASCLGCQASLWSFSFVWLNPPFDDHYGGGRVEKQFLDQATLWLRPGGVLALVCPEDVARCWDLQQQFMQWYEDILTVPFPDGHRRFEEVIVFGVRRKSMVDYYKVDWDDVQAGPGHVYRIPPSDGPRRFEKVEMTEAEMRRALAGSPLRKYLTSVPEAPLPSPPLSLGKGHVALLLASGHLDGVVSPPGVRPHVVRGTARKRQYVSAVETTEGRDGEEVTKTILSEKIELIVRVVDVRGEIKTFGEE